MRIRFHGHACFEIQGKAGTVIIDPFLSDNPSAVVKPEDFLKLDAILVSHGHGDHLGDAIQLSRRTGAPIIGTYELTWHCEHLGATIHAMHIGGKHQFPFGVVKLTQAWHGSGFAAKEAGETMLYAGPACGFLLNMDGQWIYHAGDTGLFGDMELIGRRHPLTVAMLPIGDNYGMGPEDAVYAAQLLKPKILLPMHYDTFPLIKQDVNEFINSVHRKALETKGYPLKPGEYLDI
ncbi:MAG: metal-dependent hydrolase [Desulfitobacteriaceae bacterium]